MWESDSIDLLSKHIISNIRTWLIIYGSATIGQIIYVTFPLLVVAFYSARSRRMIDQYRQEQDDIKEKWNMH
jgi:hypothetical protein